MLRCMSLFLCPPLPDVNGSKVDAIGGGAAELLQAAAGGPPTWHAYHQMGLVTRMLLLGLNGFELWQRYALRRPQRARDAGARPTIQRDRQTKARARQHDLMVVEERHHAVVHQVGGGQRRLPVLELRGWRRRFSRSPALDGMRPRRSTLVGVSRLASMAAEHQHLERQDQRLQPQDQRVHEGDRVDDMQI